jgi:hypothetical protein
VRLRALTLALLVVGCIPQIEGPRKEQAHLPKKPGQETAEALLQQRLEELTGWQPSGTTWRWPEVEWVEGAALTCYGEGWYTYYPQKQDGSCALGSPVLMSPKEGPGLTTGGPACKVCLLGLSLLAENVIESNWRDGKAIHESSLAHEYCHFFEQFATGDADSTHTGPCYTGPRWVELLNRDLLSARL